MLSAIVMASGNSNRMGKNKLLLPYQGKYIIEHTLDLVVACFEQSVLVAKDDQVIELGQKRGMNVIRNTDADKGQSESMKLGILNFPNAMGYVFFTSDQPLMDKESLKILKKNYEQSPNSIIIPTYQGKKGSPVIFPQRFRDELLAVEGDTGGRIVIQQHLDDVKYVEISNPNFLWDIDTLHDFHKLLGWDEAYE